MPRSARRTWTGWRAKASGSTISSAPRRSVRLPGRRSSPVASRRSTGFTTSCTGSPTPATRDWTSLFPPTASRFFKAWRPTPNCSPASATTPAFPASGTWATASRHAPASERGTPCPTAGRATTWYRWWKTARSGNTRAATPRTCSSTTRSSSSTPGPTRRTLSASPFTSPPPTRRGDANTIPPNSGTTITRTVRSIRSLMPNRCPPAYTRVPPTASSDGAS